MNLCIHLITGGEALSPPETAMRLCRLLADDIGVGVVASHFPAANASDSC